VFAEKVIANFIDEYSRGRTPNPCIRCNEFIKFDALLTKALALGAEFVATGHYVRLSYDEIGRRHVLRKSSDTTKDQSYVLYVLKQQQLAHSLFPLGEMTKDQTRQLAKNLALQVADKPDSQEICFVPDNKYGDFLNDSRPGISLPGPIVDKTGKVMGKHKGIVHYTIGQRRGLGLASQRPLYVVALDVSRNAVVVGEEAELYARGLVAGDVNWVSINRPENPIGVSAKIRYRAREVQATLHVLDNERVEIMFAEPQKAVAPGQAVVFYDDDLLLGGGIIANGLQQNRSENRD
ncbi:MAG: tRNA 2-thiouridine(34) synthase MnmA, partial [Dehalococcoidia bacterium]|nr:tRNA 2-thiouridine(34) synthase MnmA [Dehalococcoidia bacterium]